jgi:hypothetical protein
MLRHEDVCPEIEIQFAARIGNRLAEPVACLLGAKELEAVIATEGQLVRMAWDVVVSAMRSLALRHVNSITAGNLAATPLHWGTA